MESIELVARRKALGMTHAEMARMLLCDESSVSTWESGWAAIPPEVEPHLVRIEGRADEIAQMFTDAVEAGGLTDLTVHVTDEEFWSAHPLFRGLPVVLEHVAAAWVQTEQRSEGRQIAIRTAPMRVRL